MSNILVTGATGQLGKAVTESLLKKTDAANINILVRDADKASEFEEAGVSVHKGDYDDYPALLAAFKGIDKLYLVSGNDIPNRLKQQENVIKAAKEAGVKHLIYTSFQRKDEYASSPIAFVEDAHLKTEEALKKSGLTYTILEHGLYADIIPFFTSDKLMETKTIFLPAGDGKAAFALRTDMAEAGANILLDDTGKYDNKSIEITGNEALSWGDIAAMISTVTGSQINYVSPAIDDFNSALKNASAPEWIIQMLGGFNLAIGQGAFENVTSDLENILGREPKTVYAFLQSVYGK